MTRAKFSATFFRLALGCAVLLAPRLFAGDKLESRLKDIATIEGVRDNPLVGYGIVVGLKGTGDSQQTVFSMQTLANIMQRMGLQVSLPRLRRITLRRCLSRQRCRRSRIQVRTST